ncbi:MAG: hypothetical protein GSR72_00100 [Desulfurococcales archaeon]|nr:hypothetical protein [Desulfurococcales archaeon]
MSYPLVYHDKVRFNVYRVYGAYVRWERLLELFNKINEARGSNPKVLLWGVRNSRSQVEKKYLYMSISEIVDGSTLFGKIGIIGHRATEKFNMEKFIEELTRYDPNRPDFYPAHFVLFEYNREIFLIHEIREYPTPRASATLRYLSEVGRKLQENFGKIHYEPVAQDPRKSLKGYTYIEKIELGVKRKGISYLVRLPGKISNTIKAIKEGIGARSSIKIEANAGRGKALEISIDEVISLLDEITIPSKYISSYKVKVKKSMFQRPITINVLRDFLYYERTVRRAVVNGQVYNSSDTDDVKKVLLDLVGETKEHLDILMK